VSVAVVIPLYKAHPTVNERLVFEQAVRVLRRRSIFLVCPTKLDLSIYERICAETSVNVDVKRFDDRFFADIYTYSSLLMSQPFYREFLGFEFMLVHQLDAWIFEDQLDDWCARGFDFIGAPWFKGFDRATPNAKMLKYAGNGGFSLRRLAAVRAVVENPRPLLRNKHLEEREDFFFVNYAGDFAPFEPAPSQQAIAFAFECQPSRLYEQLGRLPMGCHGWETYEPSFWRSFIPGQFESV